MDTTFQNSPPRSGHFERQLEVPGHRMCGSAALVMAYRKMAMEADQATVWARIAQKHGGDFRAHTYRMAQDAIERGFVATIVQTHRPWQLLSTCWRNGISVITNHRLADDSSEGHYSRLAGIGPNTIKLDDPLLGPAKEIEREVFLNRWLPTGNNCEIAGNVALVIARAESQPAIWCHCNRPLKDFIDCRRCSHQISLKPAIALGCWNPECRDRLWHRIFCPQCDFPVQQIDSD